MSQATAVILAAGRGTRLGSPEKILLPLGGRPLLSYALDAFEAARSIAGVVIVAGSHTLAQIETLIAASTWRKVGAVVPGGERRQDSVEAGLRMVPQTSTIVVVHDGARPFVTADLIDRCVGEAARSGAAIAATPVTDTLKRVDDGIIRDTVPRAGLWAAQTPQAAKTELLLAAFTHADGREVTDEASLLEAFGISVAVVPSTTRNLKITTADDLVLAEALLGIVTSGNST